MSRQRLIQLRDETEAAGVQMVFDRARFDRLRDAKAPKAISAFNLFQTPQIIADRMAGLLAPSLLADSVVLEPSAGLGRLYTALRKVHAGPVVLAEQSEDCCGELYEITQNDHETTLKQGDFLDMTCEADAVLMNPPFKMGRDVKHIKHALAMLKPGGLLVSLCYNGVKQNKHLKPIADTWEILPPTSFKSEGTRAEIALLTIRK